MSFLRQFVVDIVRQELDKQTAAISSNWRESVTDSENGKLHKLSLREREVLVLISNGYTRNEISSALGVTYNTACSHISNIYTKLSISSVAEATQIAIRSGLV